MPTEFNKIENAAVVEQHLQHFICFAFVFHERIRILHLTRYELMSSIAVWRPLLENINTSSMKKREWWTVGLEARQNAIKTTK
jgi:hypothetical protein